MPSEGLAWYAVAVKRRTEKAVASALAHKGYECFLPLYESSRQWSDRVKTIAVPLFPGYIFSRFDVRFRLPILVTPCVSGIAGNGKVPASIDEAELEAVRHIVRDGLAVEPWDFLEPGDYVSVVRGPLKGLGGSLIRLKGRYRLVLSITLIQRAVAVEIDSYCVEPVRHHLAIRSNQLAIAS